MMIKLSRVRPLDTASYMSYRLEHSFEGDTLRVTLSGAAAPDNLDALMHEIIGLARRWGAMRLLVDVRGLADEIGPIDTLSLVERYSVDTAGKSRRVAVLETQGQTYGHAFHETAATNRGYPLRHFTNPAEAERWLRR